MYQENVINATLSEKREENISKPSHRWANNTEVVLREL
jgi:hypothetical protein